MSDFLNPIVQTALEKLAIEYTAVECDPDSADTAEFCAKYGYSLEQSANALLVGSTKGEPKFAACLVLANCRLDVNKTVRQKLEVRKLSFASPEDTRRITGMELGGVTPIALPADLPLWIDSRVLDCEQIIIGGGNRSSKLLLAPTELHKVPQAEFVEGLAKEAN